MPLPPVPGGPVYPPVQAPFSGYPPTSITFGPETGTAVAGSPPQFKIRPDTAATVDDQELFTFNAGDFTASNDTTGNQIVSVAGSAIQFPIGSIFGLGTGYVFKDPVTILAVDNPPPGQVFTPIVVTLPGGTAFFVNTTQLILGALSTPGTAQAITAGVTALTTPSLLKNLVLGTDAAVVVPEFTPVGQQVGTLSGFSGSAAKIVNTFGPSPLSTAAETAVIRSGTGALTTVPAAENLGGELIGALSQVESTAVFVQQQVFVNQQVVGRSTRRPADDVKIKDKTDCLADTLQDVPPAAVPVQVCAFPPKKIRLGAGKIPLTSLEGTTGFFDNRFGALAMQGALQNVHPATGDYRASFVRGVFNTKVDTYDPFTFLKNTIAKGSYDGGAWYVPNTLTDQWPGKNPSTWAQIMAHMLPALLGDSGLVLSGPRGSVSPGEAGLRIGAFAETSSGPATHPAPSANQIHWLQVVGNNQKAVTLKYLTAQGANSLTLTQALAFMYTDPRTGLFWIMDNAGSPTNAFYDTAKSDGFLPGSGGNAHNQWFADLPINSNIGDVTYFVLVPSWYLKADRITPSDVPVTLTAPPYDPSGAYTFIASWGGLDFFALNANAAAYAASWLVAVASDALYPNFPGPFSDTTSHYRNDWACSGGSADALFIPGSENVARASTTICAAGTTPWTGPTMGGISSINYTPLAICEYGIAYGYSISLPDGTPNALPAPGFLPIW